MVRISLKEMEQDCSRIKEAAKTATCMKDLENMTGLSVSQINCSLAKHPIIFKRIKEQLATNKANAEAMKMLESKTKEHAKILDQKENELDNLKAEQLANAGSQTQNVSNAQGEQCIEFVIDASITGYEGLEDVLAQIRATEAKITLPSITIHELDKLQKRDDIQALDARHILALAAKEPENFKLVAIDYSKSLPSLWAKESECFKLVETPPSFPTADDNIIQYCIDNKDKVTLLTADKVMALKARMYGVHVEYLVLPSHFPKIQDVTSSETQTSKVTTPDASKKLQSSTVSQKMKDAKVLSKGGSRFPIRTLPYVQCFGNKLTFSCFHTNKMSARVFANGREYNSGIVNLKVGDDIFIVTKQTQGIQFEHYKMVNLSSENNCQLVFNKTILCSDTINTILNGRYRAFIRDCMRKV